MDKMMWLVSCWIEDDCCGGSFYPTEQWLFKSKILAVQFMETEKLNPFYASHDWYLDLMKVEDDPKS